MAKDKKSSMHLFRNAKRVLKLVWNIDRKIFLLFIFFGLLSAGFPILLSYFYKLVLDKLITASQTGGVVTAVLLSLFSFRYVLSLGDSLWRFYRYQYLGKIFRFKMENALTFSFAKKMSELDMPHFENTETQNLIKKTTAGYTWRISEFTEDIFFALISIATFVGSFLVLLPFGFWIPLVMIGATVPRFILKNRHSKVAWSIFNQDIPEAKDLWYLSGVLESPESLKEIRISQSGPALLKKLAKLQEHIFKNTLKPLRRYILNSYVPTFLESGTLFVLVYLKLGPAAAGLISIGTFTFFVQMLDRISNSSQELVGEMARLYEQNLYVGYYFDVLNLPKVIKEKVPGHEFSEITPPKIQFLNVNFSYPGGPKVLKNISFELKPGEHLAIVGPNGAGKTTLTKLLLRFYDPTEGQILVNDYDLRDLKLNHWYKFIGTLFQDFIKFFLSVKDNILLGNAELIDEKKMKEAADKSGADEFIEKLPKKYNQRLGKRFEEGVELSHGQWQKLALARAFYEEAPVLILDEPTSSIDAEAEAKIFDNLYKVYKDKSLIVISHRFSTVKNADKIIVLQNGRITEEGNHEALMAKDGVYARMFRKQASGYIE